MSVNYKKGLKYVNGMAVAAAVRWRAWADDGVTIYTATRWADGGTSCNCPAWTRSMRRHCKHVERVAIMTASASEEGIDQAVVSPPANAVNPKPRQSDGTRGILFEDDV